MAVTTVDLGMVRGADGASILFGEAAPTTQGKKGDFYLNTASYDIYSKASGSWVKIGNIKGATGPTGAPGTNGKDGAPGAKGTDGKAATVKVGTVTTLQPGQPATVNNSGTENAAVLNFGIPQGQAGSGGAGGGLRFVELSLTGIREGTLLMSTNYETDASERFYNIDTNRTMIGLLESGLYLVMGSFVFNGDKGSSADNAYLQIFGSDGFPFITVPMAKGIGFSSLNCYVASVCQILDWENVEAFGFAVYPADTVQNGASPGEDNHVTILKLK